MKKRKKIIILALQVIILIGVGMFIYNYTNNTIEPTTAFVFTTNIDNNRPITESDITSVSIPSGAINEYFETNKDEIIGKYVDGKAFSGQYVYSSQLIEKEEIDPIESMDLSKYRKISLPIDIVSGLAGSLKRGDSVDLIYTGEGTAKNGNEESNFKYSKVFLQDVLVYGLNTTNGTKYVDQSDKTNDEIADNANQDLGIITLVVTLEQAEEIHARLSSGTVGFLGRFEDSQSYETLGYVLGDYQKIFSGQSNAETGKTPIIEDDFEVIK